MNKNLGKKVVSLSFIFTMIFVLAISFATSYNGDFCNSTNTPCSLTGLGETICTSTDLSNMYQGYDFVTDSSGVGNISGWNTSCITNMSAMFYDSVTFNQDISSWNTGNVEDMSAMFGASNYLNPTIFNQPIGSWDVSKVSQFFYMFKDSKSFNQNINTWNTSSAINMNSMFSGADAFNRPLDNWNTGNVEDMGNMFAYTPIFNQSLNTWDVSKVIHFYFMFNSAQSFNQPLDNWNTSSAESMNGMFTSNYGYNNSFNQDISSWDYTKIVEISNSCGDGCGRGGMSRIFYNDLSGGITSFDTCNYDKLLNTLATQDIAYGLGTGEYGAVEFTTVKYSNASITNRDILVTTKGMNLVDGGLDDTIDCNPLPPINCTEDWIPSNTACNGFNYTIGYIDLNNCNTTNNLPVDNGTIVNCTIDNGGGFVITNVDTQPIIYVVIALMVLVLVIGLLLGFFSDSLDMDSTQVWKYVAIIVTGTIVILIVVLISVAL